MVRPGRLTKWIEQTGYMKIKYVILAIGFFLFFQMTSAKAQARDYRKDSVQFKMYTRLYINAQLGLDSISIRKIYCDYCTEKQMRVLRGEAIRQSHLERRNPRYNKKGEHRLALYVRFSKEDFKKLNQK